MDKAALQKQRANLRGADPQGARIPGDLHVIVRGWLHGNCVVVSGQTTGLIDTGYHTGVADVREALAGDRPTDIALTHVHSDHAGGVAALAAWSGARVHAHPDAVALTAPWDARGLWLEGTGQELPRFSAAPTLSRGATITLGDHAWGVLHTPGHATGVVSLLRDHDGVLVSGDALWEDGFGLLNPWVDGPDVFDQAAAAIDTLEATRATLVIPGHGAPFTDLDGAIARARSRLARLRADPERLHRKLLDDLVGFARLAAPERDQIALRDAARASFPPLFDRPS